MDQKRALMIDDIAKIIAEEPVTDNIELVSALNRNVDSINFTKIIIKDLVNALSTKLPNANDKVIEALLKELEIA